MLYRIALNCVFRQGISPLKAFLCVTTAIGVVMVVQPTFLFKAPSFPNHYEEEIMNRNISEQFKTLQISRSTVKSFNTLHGREIVLHSRQESPMQDNYPMGVAIAFACAFSASLSLVLSAKAKRCPNHIIMIAVGFGTLLVGLIGPLINLPNRFLAPMDAFRDAPRSQMSLPHIYMLTTSASIISLLGSFLLICASQFAPPTLISTIRSCEILFALLAEKVLLSILQEEHKWGKRNRSMVWLVLGALLVLSSAILMTISDWVQRMLDSILKGYSPKMEYYKPPNDKICEEEYDQLDPSSVQTTLTTIEDINDLKYPSNAYKLSSLGL